MTLPDPGPVVIIGLKEIYDALVSLQATVATLVGQHTSITQDLREHETRANAVHDDHESRLRSLERGRWPLPAATVLLALAALVIGVLDRF